MPKDPDSRSDVNDALPYVGCDAECHYCTGPETD
jgi:DNA repair photolyase